MPARSHRRSFGGMRIVRGSRKRASRHVSPRLRPHVDSAAQPVQAAPSSNAIAAACSSVRRSPARSQASTVAQDARPRRDHALVARMGRAIRRGCSLPRQLAVRVTGEQDCAPRIVASRMLQRRRHQRGERHAKQAEMVERLARERKNVDVVTAPGQRERQRARGATSSP